MKKLQYKTNINCGGCIATVTPFLNKVTGIEKWEVDTQKPDKILTVQGEISSEEIEKAVTEAGFKIERKKGILGLF
jgi:copper chaperone